MKADRLIFYRFFAFVYILTMKVLEIERNQIKERQNEGIRIANLIGIYKNRKTSSEEKILEFLEKPQNKKEMDFLKKGYKCKEAAVLAEVHYNTVTKIKKLGFVNRFFF
ncbi:MAG: hypothetical protein ACOYO1_02355 [Bacteroidales bacterium]